MLAFHLLGSVTNIPCVSALAAAYSMVFWLGLSMAEAMTPRSMVRSASTALVERTADGVNVSGGTAKVAGRTSAVAGEANIGRDCAGVLGVGDEIALEDAGPRRGLVEAAVALEAGMSVAATTAGGSVGGRSVNGVSGITAT